MRRKRDKNPCHWLTAGLGRDQGRISPHVDLAPLPTSRGITPRSASRSLSAGQAFALSKERASEGRRGGARQKTVRPASGHPGIRTFLIEMSCLSGHVRDIRRRADLGNRFGLAPPGHSSKSCFVRVVRVEEGEFAEILHQMRFIEVGVDANEGFLLGAGLVCRVDLVELFPPSRLLHHLGVGR
jgi:hypothetical protein